MSIMDHPSVRGPQTMEPDRESAPQPDETFTSPDRLVVRPWWDPYLAVNGLSLTDPYIEAFWLGVLGPSVVCLLRRFARGFDKHPNGFQLSLADTARAIGLGSGTGRNAPINRTIERASTFHLIRRVSPTEIDVRVHMPRLSRRQVTRLPLSVQLAHDNWVSHSAGAHGSPSDSGTTSKVA